MEKRQIIILSLIFLALFILVYSPHINDRFPLHVDEWHHIQEAREIGANGFNLSNLTLEVGFQVFLYILSFFINLVFSYQFLPAIWAVVSGIVLYLVVWKKTDNIWIAILSVLFFTSIKSNVNLMGLWFFAPMTFAFPFIFAFMYFYSEGLERKSKKYVLISLLFMLFLIPTHVLSFSFAIPILFIYSLLHRDYIKKEWKFFSVFLAIPILTVLFFATFLQIPLSELFSRFVSELSFKHGWGVFERTNSFLETYSLVGYFFALMGFFVLAFSKRKHLLYLIWPSTVLFSIFFFRIFDVSYFSPYQRNMSYFVISLPFLSAVGAYWSFDKIKEALGGGKKRMGKVLNQFIFYLLILFSITSLFMGYYSIDSGINVYHPINEEQFEALTFLGNQQAGVVMVRPMQGVAVYPISGHQPFTTTFFYNTYNKDLTKEFFSADCERKDEIILETSVDYVFENSEVDCGWKAIYNKSSYIYDVKNGSKKS